jgi:hypothetical protein
VLGHVAVKKGDAGVDKTEECLNTVKEERLLIPSFERLVKET